MYTIRGEIKIIKIINKHAFRLSRSNVQGVYHIFLRGYFDRGIICRGELWAGINLTEG